MLAGLVGVVLIAIYSLKEDGLIVYPNLEWAKIWVC